ncbi:MAG: hypothetical protein NTZ33_16165 [Bacteroidetes bacterium]|nr:hypothetical protein [Bacteroidota bacterium]
MLTIKAQYPFEVFDTVKLKTYNDWKTYDWTKKKNALHFTMTIPGFYQNKDTLTIQFSSFAKDFQLPFFITDDLDSSKIRIFRNKIEIQKFKEEIWFLGKYNFDGPLVTADFNGDGLTDIKINVWYMGNGLASLYERVIYFFQTSEGRFNKISYKDMDKRVERDFDKDGNFEIITMTLNSVKEHNYWTFDLFNYVDGKLINVDEKFNYPIMIQYLNKSNYKITTKISSEIMKKYKLKLPEELNIQ